ncbi:hypothetical protein [Allorhodopirellula solitaria]|uniref:Secreted protein n=1 Tax=Allorhodopirellula solitaria TaxID=2527987 RepID=A0A5C5X9Z9_9BACT|nr:hypothetical protein [Allorhodopirellula solitaria]TWT59231.1 hypothetical protein CA85_39270 [Allorhodopirellula solitaria]
MNRLLVLLLISGIVSVSGCGRSNSSNIMDSADQEAIDAYDAQAEKDAAALGDYKEID